MLRGNTIINNEDPNQPHRGTLQGIGCFDGMFVDWIIENNVIVVDHYHGITLGGARGCRIVNNTVIDPNDQRPGPAALRVGKHKRGMTSSGCTVRNNLVSALYVEGERDDGGSQSDRRRTGDGLCRTPPGTISACAKAAPPSTRAPASWPRASTSTGYHGHKAMRSTWARTSIPVNGGA